MKKINVRVIALLLTILCIVPFFSCDKQDKDEEKKTTKQQTSQKARSIRLPYSKEDSLNPYAAKSVMNRSLIPLIYDSLYTIDSSYKAQPSIAQSGVVNGLEITVRLNLNKRFQDGSNITADDVVYSFQLAKNSEFYSKSVENIKKAETNRSDEVVFTLDKNDVYALSCLNFPIVKNGTATIDGNNKNNRNDVMSQYNKNEIPVASGRYYVDDKDDTKYLKVNKQYKDYSPVNSKIELVNITDSKAIIHSLVIGNIDSLFCDLSGGSYERINASAKDVVMNNFAFLGINKYSRKLADPKLRQAISCVLDREKIVNEGFQGHAVESYAYAPFNPKWYALSPIKELGKDIDKNKALLYIEKNAPKLNLKLLINSDNEFKKLTAQTISKILQTQGITVTITELPWEAYNRAVTSNNYDIYLGEIKLTNNMNLYPLLQKNSQSYKYYTQLIEGKITMQNFLNKFYDELPFIPLCYRKGVLAFSRNIGVEVKSNENNIYENIGEWNLKND